MRSLPLIVKYLLYYVLIVALIIGCVALFKIHPEVQLAFWIPGAMIIVYSIIRDEFFVQHHKED